MSRFFIERPIFAWVIALLIMVVGALSVLALPIAQYPSIAPPAVEISARYPGASADVVQASVTQVIEQQLKGVDNLIYFSSSSTSNGQASIVATFRSGTDPDIAQVQVQNKVQQAAPLLPVEVQEQGLTVAKAQPAVLLVVGLYSVDPRYGTPDIGDYQTSVMQDPLSRVDGVGDAQALGAQYAIRIWLDPYKLRGLGLHPADIRSAVQTQNRQVSGGQVGALPSLAGQALNATVNVQSRLTNAEQFRQIVLRTEPDGSVVKLGDVARVELGSEDYNITTTYNGRPGAGMRIKLAPGADALKAVEAVKARATELSQSFPSWLKLTFPVDNTRFIRISIEDVVWTLLEAIVLVVLVMFLFLQNWRATIIPAIAVPVVLLGTFGVLAAAGYSINTLTLFALVLAIGLLVDDAIVVVENVQRIMDEERLPPKEATIKSMGEITGALVGITTCLSAVFLPMAFFGGSTGIIYRQFSITILSAMVLSVVVALVLTPALCATMLRPRDAAGGHAGAGRGRFFRWFNRGFERTVAAYLASLRRMLDRRAASLAVYALLLLGLALLLGRLSNAFLPDEDQGLIIAQYTLPPGATNERTAAVSRELTRYFMHDEKSNLNGIFTVTGFNFGGVGQNVGLAFITLADWSRRAGSENSAQAIAARASEAFSRLRDARVFVFVPPAVRELGNVNGFDFQLLDQGDVGYDRLLEARNQLLQLAARSEVVTAVRPNGQEDQPQLKVDVDVTRAGALGLNLRDVNDTVSAALGGVYINQFNDLGRIKRVFMQGDAPFRMEPEDLDRWHVRSASGEMVPFSAFANSRWSFGPVRLERYNGRQSFNLQGEAAPGHSSGDAMDEMERLARQLPSGIGFDWTGLSYQEREAGSQGPLLYGLAILAVFLCLAALYESWSVPVAVLLVIPLGVIGAVIGATIRGFDNDIYFQVGLLTTIGLTAKNAILIVEFAVFAEAAGKSALDAAMEAAKLRLRPILMTSFAFIAGAIPLATATGAGSGSQRSIGTAVIGGMLAATILAIYFVPLFYVLIRSLFKDKLVVHESPSAHLKPAE